jgi:hypothetical protein
MSKHEIWTVLLGTIITLALGACTPVMAAPTAPQATSCPPVMPAGEDDLGIPYSVEISSPDLELVEWTTYRDQFDRFRIAGEVHLAEDAEPLVDVLTTVRSYGPPQTGAPDGKLLDVSQIHNVAFRLEPGRSTRFEGVTQLEPELIDHYAVTFKVVR